MNAMQTAAATKPTTIGELKQYLTELEAAWTELDERHLGKFDDQGLYLDYAGGGGIGQAEATYWAEFGLTFLIKE